MKIIRIALLSALICALLCSCAGDSELPDEKVNDSLNQVDDTVGGDESDESIPLEEIPIAETDDPYTSTIDEQADYNDAHDEMDGGLNYEIAPDMYVNVEWVANITVQECQENNIGLDAVQYFISAIDEMAEKDDYYNDLYDKLTALYELMK